MSLRPVTDADIARVEGFLMRYIETSVFLISNLRKFGPSGGAHSYAMRYWMAENTGGDIAGIVAQSTGGTVMAQWPVAPDWPAAIATLPDPITGFIGDGDQMNALRAAAGLTNAETSLDAAETLYALDLTDIIPQPGHGTLRPILPEDAEALVPWRADYAANTLGEPAETAETRGREEITSYIAANSHRVLVDGDRYLSMTGFNATVDELVQVGGVYTPPEGRGQGLARRAVALHLQEAAEAGSTRAILFANDPSAMAAYEAIGFKPIGSFALIMFKEGHEAK